MNSSLATADSATHLKIVLIALAASIFVMLIAISAHLTDVGASFVGRRVEMQIPPVDLPQVRPPSGAEAVIA